MIVPFIIHFSEFTKSHQCIFYQQEIYNTHAHGGEEGCPEEDAALGHPEGEEEVVDCQGVLKSSSVDVDEEDWDGHDVHFLYPAFGFGVDGGAVAFIQGSIPSGAIEKKDAD